MDLIESAKQTIAQKNFKKLDDLWTEMVLDKRVNLNHFFEIAKLLKKSHESERALLLLEMLATQCEADREYHKAIEVYKNMVYHVSDVTEIRKNLIRLFKDAYPKSKHLDEYRALSGFDRGESIFNALKKLEEFLKYDIGRYFYFERYGIGKIIDTIPSKREVVIDFEQKKRHYLTLDIARGLLTPIHKEHFLYIKHENVSVLKEKAVADPVELIKLLLKSFEEPLTASRIKLHLQGLIEKQNINKFWERVRKKLENDRDIKISGKTQKTYTYDESALDKTAMEIAAFDKATEREKYLYAEAYAKKMPAVFEKILPRLVDTGNRVYKQDPALALDILMLCRDLNVKAPFSYTLDSIIDKESPERIIKTLNNLEHQRRLLALIRDKNPQKWPHILKNLIFTVDNLKLLDEIAANLECMPDILHDVYYTIFSVPKRHPEQFQWMLKKIQSGDLQEYLEPKFIPKLIDSLNYVRGIKGMVKRILSLENFDAIVKRANDKDAQRILETINNSTVLDAYNKKDFSRIIEYHCPHLFTHEGDVIYTTEAALNKKREELNRIMTIEIPKNKKEISRAREFGDLSENFEYKAAKERQDQLYRKLRMIESELVKMRLIDPAKINTSQVDIGTKISLKRLQDDKLIHYTILGRWDTDLEKNIIANDAPVGQALLGKARGDRVTIDNIEYEIVNIEKAI